MSQKRKKLSRSYSQGYFTHTARQVHPKNLQAVPMRGGFRL